MSVMRYVLGAIVCSEPEREVRREEYGEERWCFRCRKRRGFDYVVTAPVDLYSYYGPRADIRCSVCDLVDGDMFPGTYRIWGEE